MNWGHHNESEFILNQRDSSIRPVGPGPPRVEAESGGSRAGGGVSGRAGDRPGAGAQR